MRHASKTEEIPRKVTIEVENLISCNLCEFDTDLAEELNEHEIRGIHMTKNVNRKDNFHVSHSCDKCSFVSKTKIGLERHFEYFCHKCRICLAEKIEFEIHSSLHGECELHLCKFVSTSSHNLRDHVAMMHPKDHFPCSKCDYILKSEKQGYFTLVINSNFVRYEFG